jgi:prefoldin alpha subunit
MEIRLLEGSARVLQSRYEVIQAALREVLISNSTLEGVSHRPKGTETLVPIGGDSYVKAEISDSEQVIMGIGAGVCMEKKIEDSIAELKERQTELEKTRVSVEQQLGQILTQLENDRGRLNDFLRKKSGENVEVV